MLGVNLAETEGEDDEEEGEDGVNQEQKKDDNLSLTERMKFWKKRRVP